MQLFQACGHETIFSFENILTSNSRHYIQRGQEADDAGDLKTAHICVILGCICSLSLVPADRNLPFSPEWQGFDPPRRAFLPEDLSDDDILLLQGIFDHIQPVWLKARVADVLWLVSTENKIHYARAAIETYQLLPLEPISWRKHQIGRCWERAYSLSLQIRQNESSDQIKVKLLSEIRGGSELMDQLSSILSLGGLEDNELDDVGGILLNRAKDVSGFTEETKKYGFFMRLWKRLMRFKPVQTQGLSQGEYSRANNLVEQSRTMFSASSNAERKTETLVVQSWVHEKDGDNRMQGDLGGQLGALYSYQDALHTIRQIPNDQKASKGVEAKIRTLRKKIRRAGEHAQGQLLVTQVPTGVTPELMREAESHINSASGVDSAVFRYSELYTGPKRSDWIDMANESSADFAFSGLFGATHLNDGRVVAQQAGMGFGESPTQERSEDDARFSFLRACVPFIVRGMLIPGHSALLSRHTVPVKLMMEIAHRSPLVAQDRVALVGFGLHRGFEFDFPTAVHILAPQLEKIVRDMVRDRGGNVSTIDPATSVENYIALGSLLDKPEALDALGEDLLFEIRSIFTDKRGPNLRNDVAHGEMNDVSSQGDYCVYAWWLILRMICNSLYEPTVPNE